MYYVAEKIHLENPLHAIVHGVFKYAPTPFTPPTSQSVQTKPRTISKRPAQPDNEQKSMYCCATMKEAQLNQSKHRLFQDEVIYYW